MKTSKTIYLLMLLLCLPASVAAQLLPAFPGAEGHGRYIKSRRF